MMGLGIRYSEISAGRESGHARVVEAFDEADRRAGRLLGALDDDRAPSRQRRRDLAHRLRDGEVPGREAGDRPDRLHDHHVAHAVGARRDDAAVGALPLAGVPVDDVGGAGDLKLGLHQHLALLEGEHLGDVVDAGADEIGGLAQDLAALEGGHLAPGLEALVGGCQRLVEVALGGMAKLAQRRVLGGVHDLLAFARGLDPIAVDVVFERCVGHGCSILGELRGKGGFVVTNDRRAGLRKWFSRRSAFGAGGCPY